ncbi:hypothetical protein ACTMTI_09950 [Nonomuraea sp. H19]|uniref:hypothetical protein n=1 Tax=Nonomuraea sp. H19 TaxID=3452206 RepID=UPI003F8C2F57
MNWRIPSWAFLLWVAALAVSVIAMALHMGRLFTEPWLPAPIVLIAAVWLFALLSVPALVVLARRGRPLLTNATYAIMILGVVAPAPLGFMSEVSATCRVVTWESPDRVGLPGDAVGYAHFTGTPSGFGRRICPRFELAGGWWWLDACGQDG